MLNPQTMVANFNRGDSSTPPSLLRGVKVAARATFNPAQSSGELLSSNSFSLWDFRSTENKLSKDASHNNPSP
jgi:hypothetical protein